MLDRFASEFTEVHVSESMFSIKVFLVSMPFFFLMGTLDKNKYLKKKPTKQQQDNLIGIWDENPPAWGVGMCILRNVLTHVPI